MKHAYPLIQRSAGRVPTAIAVQEGNYAYLDARTGRRVSVRDLCAFAVEYLRVDHIFWCTEEPYYTEQVLPFLAGGALKDSARP
jgi:hypothetical protein